MFSCDAIVYSISDPVAQRALKSLKSLKLLKSQLWLLGHAIPWVSEASSSCRPNNGLFKVDAWINDAFFFAATCAQQLLIKTGVISVFQFAASLQPIGKGPQAFPPPKSRGKGLRAHNQTRIPPSPSAIDSLQPSTDHLILKSHPSTRRISSHYSLQPQI
jgi:hypothetical protein